MTERPVEDRLAALQRAGRASVAAPSADAGTPSDEPPTRRTRRTGSGGTKYALAGGATGATMALIGVMSSGSPSTNGPIAAPARPMAQPVIIVVSPPGATGPVDSGETITAETLADVIPDLPAVVESVPAAAEPVTESGGS